MPKSSYVFFAALLILVLAIAEIQADIPKLCEKSSLTYSGKCHNKKCDKKCIGWEKAQHGACHKREGKAGCFCYFDCSKSPPGATPAPPGAAPPPAPSSGGSPPAGGGSPPPPGGGGSPPADGGSPPNGGGQPPPGGGQPAPPGGGQPAPPDGGGQPAPPPPGCAKQYIDKLIAQAIAQYKAQLEEVPR